MVPEKERDEAREGDDGDDDIRERKREGGERDDGVCVCVRERERYSDDVRGKDDDADVRERESDDVRERDVASARVLV